MPAQQTAQPSFSDRFTDRRQVERYRDRFKSGRHALVHQQERAALEKLLADVGRLEVAMDLPCGTGRMADVLAKVSDRVILADSAPLMIELARECTAGLPATYLETNAEKIDLESGSVDLVFCHRLLNHVPDPAVRARMFAELARVSRKYVVVSCYPAGFRTRVRLLVGKLIGRDQEHRRPASRAEVIQHAAECGLKLVRTGVLRRIPFTAEFLMFERAG